MKEADFKTTMKLSYYEILSSPDIDFLEELVQERLRDGWTLQGGPVTIRNEICQALVKTTIIQDPVKQATPVHHLETSA